MKDLKMESKLEQKFGKFVQTFALANYYSYLKNNYFLIINYYYYCLYIIDLEIILGSNFF